MEPVQITNCTKGESYRAEKRSEDFEEKETLKTDMDKNWADNSVMQWTVFLC